MRSIRMSLFLGVALAPGRLSAQLTLAEEGGSLTDGDLARLPGASPFAIDSLAGFAIHDVSHLNDGLYGNSQSWIGDSGAPGFAGIRLGGLFTVRSIAFGRDNQPVPQYDDRYLGIYTLQYTAADDPDENTPDEAWTTAGAVENGDLCPPRPWMRHRYVFEPIEATAVRLLVPATGLEAGTCIDELEVYGDPGDLLEKPCVPPPLLQLLEAGGPRSTPADPTDVPSFEEGNGARSSAAVPFGTPPHPLPVHRIEHLNDGLYGNSQSWLGNEPGPASGKAYAGILLGGVETIRGIAIGRDNTGEYADRAVGPYIVQVTGDAFDPTDDASIDSASWTTLGQASAHLGDGSPALRHLYGFEPVPAVAVRVLTRLGNAIDEIELLGGGPEPPHRFHRGDPDDNGVVQLTDAVVILSFLFLGGEEPACLESADADNNGLVQLTDAVVILAYLFLGGAPPSPPGPPPQPCGPDTDSVVGIGCSTYTHC